MMTESRVLRFNRTERWVHTTQGVTFLVLLGTGLAISISALETMLGHRALLREIHLIAAFFFVFGPAMVALAGDRRSLRDDMKAVENWSSDDIRWLAHPSTLPDARTPPPGRYNAGQKLNAVFTVYSTLAFAVTGLILWQNRRFPFQLVSQANTVHTWLAYIALAVFLGHLYLSIVHPATRAALGGIIFGTVDRAWAQHHHPAWQVPATGESPLTLSNAVKGLGLLVVGLEAALLATRFGFELLGANVTDPVTKMIYRFSGLPGTLQNPATGVHSFDLGALFWLGLAIALWYGVLRNRALLPRTLPAPARG
jgi:formate dehydrogenase subunit gamma